MESVWKLVIFLPLYQMYLFLSSPSPHPSSVLLQFYKSSTEYMGVSFTKVEGNNWTRNGWNPPWKLNRAVFSESARKKKKKKKGEKRKTSFPMQIYALLAHIFF